MSNSTRSNKKKSLLFSDPALVERMIPGQRLDDQRVVIPDQDDDIAVAAQDVDDVARPRTLADYNRPDQYYDNIAAIRPPAIQRIDFELKPQYFTLVAQTPYCGLSVSSTVCSSSRTYSCNSENIMVGDD
ncbi:hypothetical protein F2Q70_00016914 [Brassica cretica]|uniref:Uncharacterized protein n=1 Tax=Brassica cretica TaxID=69181 RepID=A0A8S9HUF4_BRACR|nr:hypothetical protein F2Q70_00016914 [Brassica cretica]